MLENDFARINEVVGEYDLFEDWPWPLIYKELDQMFPGSKFILTVRKDEEAWLSSIKTHSMRRHPTRHCRKLAYGYSYPNGYEKEHIEFYKRHNDNARSFCERRENDFLEVCWEKNNGWNELCAFLEKDNFYLGGARLQRHHRRKQRDTLSRDQDPDVRHTAV